MLFICWIDGAEAMIEEWLVKFALCCFAVMGITAWALSEIEKDGKDFVNKNDESEDER